MPTNTDQATPDQRDNHAAKSRAHGVFTEEQRETAMALIQDGKSARSVAKLIGVSDSSVKYWAQKEGIWKKGGGYHKKYERERQQKAQSGYGRGLSKNQSATLETISRKPATPAKGGSQALDTPPDDTLEQAGAQALLADPEQLRKEMSQSQHYARRQLIRRIIEIAPYTRDLRGLSSAYNVLSEQARMEPDDTGNGWSVSQTASEEQIAAAADELAQRRQRAPAEDL